MSIRKGSSIIAGNIGQNVDSALSPTSDNPVKNSVLTEAFADTVSTKNITNCITEIPQDIKLELSGATLTLKAGSKFYYPNGLEGATPTFSSFTTTTDLALNVGGSGWTAEPHFITVLNDGTASLGYAAQDVYSGDNAPSSMSSQYGLWYDTANNIIRRTTDTGTTWTSTPYSFPICIAENTGGTCSGIIQTFNGCGYIGSIAFVLPGVTGLKPYGRNDDGTLKNQIIKYTKVSTRSVGGGAGGGTLAAAGPDMTPGFLNDTQTAKYCYDEEKNIYYTTEQDITNQNGWRLKLVKLFYNGTKITSLKPNYAFHAVDYNDAEFIAHQAMPSNKYIDLTLGASGTTYTAPADGWFTFNKLTNSNDQYGNLVNETSGINTTNQQNSTSSNVRVYLPVSKGDVVKCSYNAGGTLQWFRFIYANGSI